MSACGACCSPRPASRGGGSKVSKMLEFRVPGMSTLHPRTNRLDSSRNRSPAQNIRTYGANQTFGWLFMRITVCPSSFYPSSRLPGRGGMKGPADSQRHAQGGPAEGIVLVWEGEAPAEPGNPARRHLYDELLGNGTGFHGSFSETYEQVLQDQAFMSGLRTGGPDNGFLADAWVLKSGEPFADGRNHLFATFNQKPGGVSDDAGGPTGAGPPPVRGRARPDLGGGPGAEIPGGGRGGRGDAGTPGQRGTPTRRRGTGHGGRPRRPGTPTSGSRAC
jgi:hypothetical protein